MNGVRNGHVGSSCVACHWCLVAGSSFVDQVLDDSGVGHGESTKKEAHGDTSDGPEWDAYLSEEGVEKAVANWNEDDDC